MLSNGQDNTESFRCGLIRKDKFHKTSFINKLKNSRKAQDVKIVININKRSCVYKQYSI